MTKNVADYRCILRTVICLAAVTVASVACAQQIAWHDCKEIGVEGKGFTDTPGFYDRIPARYEGKVSPNVWNLSHNSAGICVRFTTNAPAIDVRWTVNSNTLSMSHMPATGVSGVDLYAKIDGCWKFVAVGMPPAVTNSAHFGLPSAEQYLLYLPLYNGLKSVEIGIPQGAKIAAAKISDAIKPIVVYGTSITQGGCASRPGMAWTSIVGRKLNVPVINLGFSGSGLMEPVMSDLLLELDPSVYVLDCIWNMSPQLVAERVEPFVKKLRAARPETPILLAEDCQFQDVSPTEKGKILRDVYKKLTADGVKKVYFLSNKGMLGTDCEGTVDGCHPNDLGMLRIADVFTATLRPLLKN
jgi:lysophospholipase L1-like esterase